MRRSVGCREFSVRLDATPIAGTSILNGMFMELLAGEAPFILYRFHRVAYWEDAGQPMDFTAMADTATFPAEAALDRYTPRYLRIAGELADGGLSTPRFARVARDAMRVRRHYGRTAPYCASLTCSSHSTAFPSSAS